jgi:hypothetical protein
MHVQKQWLTGIFLGGLKEMIEYLSQTMINTWSRCQQQFYFRWIENKIIPPRLAAHIGSGVHKGNEVNLKAKLVTGEDEPLDVVTDAARDGYVKRLKSDGVFFPPAEKSEARVRMAEGIDVTIGLAKTYHAQIAPGIKPKIVEKYLSIDTGLAVPITGVIDIVTEDLALIDLKTAAKKWPQGRADESIQATIYNELASYELGRYPQSIEFDVLIKGKEEPQKLMTMRTKDDWDALIMRIKAMLKAINAGVFQPAPPESWHCSPSYCGFWVICPYISKGRK